MNILVEELQQDGLTWIPELGIGYYPVKAMPYDADYFAKYQAIKETDIGLKLNQARIELVNKYTKGEVLDIGIGNGAFVETRENTFGFDINETAVQWLIEKNKYRHPFKGAESLTFWDSLEHIHNPALHLSGAKKYVFVSCPIYENVEHLLSSKHFKKDEHCWYWTIQGLTTFMQKFGFEVQEINWAESEIGREDIASFVFKRVS
jgi:hypothetical protein